MSELIDLSTKIIDSGVLSEPANRITHKLSEVADGISVVEAFSHIWSVDTGDGLVLIDASGVQTRSEGIDAVRTWRSHRVHSLVYTHGHADHVGGSGAILADADARGHPRPEIVAHEAVHDRLARYRYTNGWNLAINARQFGAPATNMSIGAGAGRFIPDDVADPTLTYRDQMTLEIGDTVFDLQHARGETDDHTWLWLPDRKAVFVGDLFIWNFPNAGNPQKVQRHAGEWATALRTMIERGPELLLPAHGLPIAGVERIAEVLDTTAAALEYLVETTVGLMNEGADLDTIIHSVKLPSRFEGVPYLLAFYDEPEFVVRNIYRFYGGWWDGDPASLKPAPRADLAHEVASLAGGPLALARRGAEVAESGDLAVACHLVQMAADAAGDDPAVHEIRRDVYRLRRAEATSLMARGVFGSAIAQSKAVLGE